MILLMAAALRYYRTVAKSLGWLIVHGLAVSVVGCGGAPRAPNPSRVALAVAEETLHASAPTDIDEPVRTRVAPWTSELRSPGAPPRLVVHRNVGWVDSAAFSADGHLLAISSNDEAILFDTASGRELQRFPTAIGQKTRLGLVAGGRRLLFGTSAQVYDVPTGHIVANLADPEKANGFLEAHSWSDDALHVLAVGVGVEWGSRTLAIYDVDTTRPRWTRPDLRPLAMSAGAERVAAFEPGKKPGEGVLVILDGATGKTLSTLPKMNIAGDDSTLLAFSSDGSALALALASQIVVFESSTGLERARITPPGASDFSDLRFVEGRRLLYVGYATQTASHVVVDVDTKRETVRADDLAWNPAFEGGALLGFALVDGRPKRLVRIDPSTGARTPIGKDLESKESVLAYHANGKVLVSPGHPTLVDLATGVETPLSGDSLGIQAIAPTATRRIMLSVGKGVERNARLFDLGSGETLFSNENARFMAVSPDGSWVGAGNDVTSTDDAHAPIHVEGVVTAIGPNASWILTDDAMYCPLQGVLARVAAPVAVTPMDLFVSGNLESVTNDGQIVASVVDRRLTVWEGCTGKTLWTRPADPRAGTAGFTGLGFDPSGTKLYASAFPNGVFLDPKTGEKLPSPGWDLEGFRIRHRLGHDGQTWMLSGEQSARRDHPRTGRAPVLASDRRREGGELPHRWRLRGYGQR